MAITMDDRIAITDLINEHGHLIDRGDFGGLVELFIEDVVYDVTAMGGTRLAGLAAAHEAALALGAGNPVAHHVTNIVLREAPDGIVRAHSKAIGIMTDGSAGSVTYDDTVERTPAGWRITHRIIRPRRVPLQQ